MSGFEVLGGISASVQLLEVILKLKKQLHDLRYDWINAEHEVLYVDNHLTFIEASLDVVSRFTTHHDLDLKIPKQKQSVVQPLLQSMAVPECRRLIDDLRKMMTKELLSGGWGKKKLSNRAKLSALLNSDKRSRMMADLDRAVADVDRLVTYYETERENVAPMYV